MDFHYYCIKFRIVILTLTLNVVKGKGKNPRIFTRYATV